MAQDSFVAFLMACLLFECQVVLLVESLISEHMSAEVQIQVKVVRALKSTQRKSIHQLWGTGRGSDFSG